MSQSAELFNRDWRLVALYRQVLKRQEESITSHTSKADPVDDESTVINFTLYLHLSSLDLDNTLYIRKHSYHGLTPLR